MKKLLIYLILLIVAVRCGNDESIKFTNHKQFERAKNSVREFGESYFKDSANYMIGGGSVGLLNKFEPPIKISFFLGSDSLETTYKYVHWEQAHYCFPMNIDSIGGFETNWTYYQMDENFKVVSFSKAPTNRPK